MSGSCSLCQLNRLPFDAQLILQRFPAPHALRDFLEAARSLGFKTGDGDIGKPAFPCVGFLKGEAPKPAILIKGDSERLLYFLAGSQTPEALPATEIEGRFEPAIILLRHKRIWRDVLIASLFIQLIGLTTPLFTQVIIDKVVVNQTQSTLIAIGVGLVMFMLFNACMSWLRQADRA